MNCEQTGTPYARHLAIEDSQTAAEGGYPHVTKRVYLDDVDLSSMLEGTASWAVEGGRLEGTVVTLEFLPGANVQRGKATEPSEDAPHRRVVEPWLIAGMPVLVPPNETGDNDAWDVDEYTGAITAVFYVGSVSVGPCTEREAKTAPGAVATV